MNMWLPGRIITYVLLCGYSPFRSEDTKELIRETTEAKIEFHERYWKNVSQQAKVFIKALLSPDPAKRPTAEQAYNDPVSSLLLFGRRGTVLTGCVYVAVAYHA